MEQEERLWLNENGEFVISPDGIISYKKYNKPPAAKESYTLKRKFPIMKTFINGFICAIILAGSTWGVVKKVHDRNEWIRVNKETFPHQWQLIIEMADHPDKNIWDYVSQFREKLPRITREQAVFLAQYNKGTNDYQYLELQGWIKE